MRLHSAIAASLLLIAVLMPFSLLAQPTGDDSTTQEQPPTIPEAPEDYIYTVRPGDTLFRIAGRFGTTYRRLAEANGIANPALIYAGQQIRIPGVAAVTPTPQPPPTVTPTPEQTTTYVVARGDTLYRIAVRNSTTIARLVTLNNLANPNIIYIGQRLLIPAGDETETIAQAAPLPAALPDQETPETPEIMEQAAMAGGFGFDSGVQAYLVDQELPPPVQQQIEQLGVRWVKVVINWRDFEPVKDETDFTTLDAAVDTLQAAGVNLLFTVTAAPAWARSSTDEDGPPDNFADYGLFLGALAQRYAGQVQAYEIWTEPNLRREWNSTIHSIGPSSYIELLRVGYTAIKTTDPNAVVVSAGLAPTGFNDGVNAINDRLFLSGLYAAGLAATSDAVGAHPQGWANPPDAVCCTAPVGVSTHYQDPSFYFLNTLNDYRQIMVENNDSSTAIWVTKFGWGTSEDTDPPSENNIFVSYTSLDEQAVYLPRAFELGAELGFVGPMFAYNLNGCQTQTTSLESCYYSLIGLDGAPRPVFDAVQQMLNPGGQAPVMPPEAPETEAPTTDTAPVMPTETPEISPEETPEAEAAG